MSPNRNEWGTCREDILRLRNLNRHVKQEFQKKVIGYYWMKYFFQPTPCGYCRSNQYFYTEFTLA